MASRFATAIDEIRAKFDELRAERERGEFPAWMVGRTSVAAHKGFPYVIWIRTDGTHGKPPNANPLVHEGVSITPRFYSRQTVLCIICGQSDEDTEQIHDEVLEATVRALGHTELPGRFDWATQTEELAAFMLAGRESVIQEFALPFIVPREIKKLTTVATSDHDCSLVP